MTVCHHPGIQIDRTLLADRNDPAAAVGPVLHICAAQAAFGFVYAMEPDALVPDLQRVAIDHRGRASGLRTRDRGKMCSGWSVRSCQVAQLVVNSTTQRSQDCQCQHTHVPDVTPGHGAVLSVKAVSENGTCHSVVRRVCTSASPYHMMPHAQRIILK